MRVETGRLAAQLARGLAPVYLIHGDEPLQIEECLDAVRRAAREQGYAERVVLHAEARFDWSELRACQDTLSLFAERRLVDLRIRARVDAEAGRALLAWVERPAPDTLLLASTGRLDGRAMKSGWYRAVDGAGVTVPVWSVEPRRLPEWVAARAATLGLALDPDAARLLAERGEGNLLACAQEVDKLALLAPPGAGSLDLETVAAVVADSARYGPFDLVDAVLAGEARRCLRILAALREEGVDPIAILGPLAWALRSVATIAGRAEGGRGLERILGEPAFGAWRNRKAVLARALARLPAPRWTRLLASLSGIDRVVKGAGDPRFPGVRRVADDAWNGLEAVCLTACGVKIPAASAYTA
jgi:DNA polymerase III subunit delta